MNSFACLGFHEPLIPRKTGTPSYSIEVCDYWKLVEIARHRDGERSTILEQSVVFIPSLDRSRGESNPTLN